MLQIIVTLQNHNVGHEKSHFEDILIIIINTNILIIIKKTNLQLNVTLDPATATSAFSGVVVITGEAVVVLLGFNYDNHDDNDTDDRDFDHDLQDLGHGLNDDNDH